MLTACALGLLYLLVSSYVGSLKTLTPAPGPCLTLSATPLGHSERGKLPEGPCCHPHSRQVLPGPMLSCSIKFDCDPNTQICNPTDASFTPTPYPEPNLDPDLVTYANPNPTTPTLPPTVTLTVTVTLTLTLTLTQTLPPLTLILTFSEIDI